MTPEEYREAVRLGECYEEVSALVSLILEGGDSDWEAMCKCDLFRLIVRYGSERVLFILQVVVDDFRNAGLV